MKKLLSIKQIIQISYWRLITPHLVRSKGVRLGKAVKFFGTPIISVSLNSNIDVGEGTVLCSDSRYTALGVNHPVIIRTLYSNAVIKIGNDCGISGMTLCAAKYIEIGNHCLIGANVTIADTDFHTIASKNRRHLSNCEEIVAKPVYIGNNVFLGAGAFILKGVRIGDNSVIGAMSVVTSDIPSDTVYGGNPAKFIKAI